MKASELRIGQRVHYRTATGNPSIPMVVTGIFTTLHDLEHATVYLDFEGNMGDVWEEDAADIELEED